MEGQELTPKDKLLNVIWAIFERHRGEEYPIGKEIIDKHPELVDYVKREYNVTLVPRDEKEVDKKCDDFMKAFMPPLF
jgi:hypothetical protein